MFVELSKLGKIINIRGGEICIKLETGDIVTKNKVLLNLSVSLGDYVNVFNNNFLTAGEKP